MSKNRYLNPSSQILFLHHLHSLTLTVRLKIHFKATFCSGVFLQSL